MGNSESHAILGDSPGDSSEPSFWKHPKLEVPFLTPEVVVDCWNSLDSGVEFELPWEKGIWGRIFADKRLELFPKQKFNRLSAPLTIDEADYVVPAKKARVSAGPDHWMDLVSGKDPLSWKEDQEAKMDVALKRWFDVLADFPRMWDTIEQLKSGSAISQQLRMLRDILAGRAPSTLIKRANSMLRYFEHLRQAGVRAPGDERVLYAFFCQERDAGAPHSRLRSLVEAIRFTEFVFGIGGLCQSLLSRRCIGAAHGNGTGTRKQAAPFTVEQLALLHQVLNDPGGDRWDRMVCGAALCAVYSRSRWMDMQHTDLVSLDPAIGEPLFLEMRIKDFKTKKANSWMGGLMEAVAPAIGVVDGNWVQAWWELRQDLAAPLEAGFPLMPAPDILGCATVRPLGTAEFGSWINMILVKHAKLAEGVKISSHSCKATLLSFLAKYGASVPDREILGGHSSRMKSVLTYSRDSLSGPLRVLNAMLLSIRNHEFMPDLSRSGYFQPAEEQQELEAKDEIISLSDGSWDGVSGVDQLDANVQHEHDEVNEAAGIEAIESEHVNDAEWDTESGSDEEGAANSHAARLVLAPKAPDGTTLKQHRKSRMLHLLQDGNKAILMCGRRISEVYEPPKSLRWDTPCCGRCWKAAKTPLGPRFA